MNWGKSSQKTWSRFDRILWSLVVVSNIFGHLYLVRIIRLTTILEPLVGLKPHENTNTNTRRCCWTFCKCLVLSWMVLLLVVCWRLLCASPKGTKANLAKSCFAIMFSISELILKMCYIGDGSRCYNFAQQHQSLSTGSFLDMLDSCASFLLNQPMYV